MRARAIQRHLHTAVAAALLLVALPSCGGSGAGSGGDTWRDRELAWRYGPTSGTAAPTHRAGAGTTGAPLAEGWRVHIVGGSKLTAAAYRLAKEHPLFGKAALAVALYDRDGKSIEMLVSPPITAANARFEFAIDEAVAKRTHDAILWFRDP